MAFQGKTIQGMGIMKIYFAGAGYVEKEKRYKVPLRRLISWYAITEGLWGADDFFYWAMGQEQDIDVGVSERKNIDEYNK